MSTFAYRPLTQARREIRLLRFDRSAHTTLGQQDAPINCFVEHVSLDDGPDYEALSYTWGDGVDNIRLDGITTAVTSNLKSALQHLYTRASPKRLWVDAICINQKDDIEKSWQVQQMRYIYASASLVVVWLGPAADDSELALQKFQQIGDGTYSKAAIDAARRGIMTKGVLTHDIDLDLFARIQSEGPLSATDSTSEQYLVHLIRGSDIDISFPLQAVKAFLARAYWQRVWVLQEVVVAKDFVFFCGNCSIPGPCLAAAMSSLRMYTAAMGRHTTTEKHNFDQALIASDLDGSAMTMFELHSGLNYEGMPSYETSLKAILSSIFVRPAGVRTLQSTDPRDRIFAFLGIAKDTAILNIRADYSQTCQAVYTELAQALLAHGDMQILSLCHGQKFLSGLPSWVPDWSSSIPETILGAPSDSRNAGLFSASGTSDPAIKFVNSADSKSLVQISGVLVGEILEVGHVLGRFGSQPSSTDIKNWLLKLESLLQYGGTAYATKERQQEAVARVPIADHTTDNQTARCRIQKSPRESFLWLSGRVAELQERYSDPMEIYPEMKRYWTIMSKTAMHRRPFVTNQGYIGLGPASLEPGDIVVVLLGSEMPFILRPGDDNAFQLVGEAYVHGIMDGEIMSNNLPMRVFKLY